MIQSRKQIALPEQVKIPWEQMAQSVFSLLLLPSECEEKQVLEGLRRLQADKQVLDSLRHLG